MRGSLVNFVALLASAVFCGCAPPPAAEGPTARILRIADRDAFLDRAMTVLREHDFQPRRADRDVGLVVTWPSTGGQWFEIWRRDVHGPYQQLESSIHTIRREVTLHLEAPDDGAPDAQRLSVRVDKSRYSAPERQVTTASGALVIYSEQIPTEEGLRRRRVDGEQWVPLGRDVLFERYLLDRIAARAGGVPAPTAQVPEPVPEPAPEPVPSVPASTPSDAPAPVGEPPPEAAQVEG